MAFPTNGYTAQQATITVVYQPSDYSDSVSASFKVVFTDTDSRITEGLIDALITATNNYVAGQYPTYTGSTVTTYTGQVSQ